MNNVEHDSKAPAADLTPTLREALTKVLQDDHTSGLLSLAEADVLIDLRNACPEPPTLEDGRYEVSDEAGGHRLRYVRDGRYAAHLRLDGSLRTDEALMDSYRNLARRVLTAAGIEVQA